MQEKFLMHDEETRRLSTRDELKNYFEFRKKNDITGVPYCVECRTIGIDDTPLLNRIIRKNEGFDESTMPDEMISEAAKDNQIMLVSPLEDKYQVFPVRYTAYPDILNAAGISGRLMYLTAKRGQYNPLAPETKGQWLTTGLHLNEQKAQVLIRDGKVEHFKGPKYQVLPEWDGSDALENYLKSEYPNHEYVDGYVSHEVLSVTWDTMDEGATESLKATLQGFGVKCEEVKFYLRFTTSEVGNAAMRVAPLFSIDGVQTQIGKPIAVRHDSGNTIDMLVKQFDDIASMTKEAEDQVEELGNTDILHPVGCFKNAANKCGVFSQTDINNQVGMIQALYATSCTAIDIYMELVEMIERDFQNTQNITAYIHKSECVAKLLMTNWKAYDHEPEEKKED